MGVKIDVKRRRLIIRSVLVLVWIGLGIILFVFNRGHKLLVDNHNVDELRAPDLIMVTVNKGKPLDFFRGDRDIFDVGGGRHSIRVEFSDGTPDFQTDFTLPLGPDRFLLSVPKMINGIEPYIEVFYSQQERRSDDDQVETPEEIP